MSDKSDEEIRKSIKKYEELLPDSEHNPSVEEDTDRLIKLASRPLPAKSEKQQPGGDYTDTQTRSHKTEDTSD